MHRKPDHDRRPLDPDTGWSVWGQPKAVAELRHAAMAGPNHSYVFAGPQMVGKRRAALDFAKTLCCPNAGTTGAFCGTCSVCGRIDRGVYPDVTVFDLNAQAERDRDKSRNLTLNISTVREVSAAVAYRPSEASWRIVIVDDAETMQETAQEAFLKTLEEPPSYALIILLATETEALLPTILSRCVSVRFGMASIPSIEQALIASGVETGKACRIAAISNGATGWALRAAADPSMVESRERELSGALEFVLGDGYARMITAVRVADEFTKGRESVFAQLQSVQRIWRSAMYLQQGVDEATAMALPDRTRKALGNVPLASLVQAVRSVDTAIANLEANVRPRLALESMVLAWPTVTA